MPGTSRRKLKDMIERAKAARDKSGIGPLEPDRPAPGSISQRVRELTGGGTLRDERNRVKALGDPELRRRSTSLLRWISNGEGS